MPIFTLTYLTHTNHAHSPTTRTLTHTIFKTIKSGHAPAPRESAKASGGATATRKAALPRVCTCARACVSVCVGLCVWVGACVGKCGCVAVYMCVSPCACVWARVSERAYVSVPGANAICVYPLSQTPPPLPRHAHAHVHTHLLTHTHIYIYHPTYTAPPPTTPNTTNTTTPTPPPVPVPPTNATAPAPNTTATGKPPFLPLTFSLSFALCLERLISGVDSVWVGIRRVAAYDIRLFFAGSRGVFEGILWFTSIHLRMFHVRVSCSCVDLPACLFYAPNTDAIRANPNPQSKPKLPYYSTSPVAHS